MKFTRNEKRKVRANVEMTPLIDVVFQLLIFFMLSSTFVVQSSVPIEVPTSEGSLQFDHKELSITLEFGEGGPDGRGRVHVNEIEIASWAELSNTLAEFHRNQPEAAVLVRPDRRVETGRTIQVLGLVTSAGINRYFIAAEPPEAQE
jgi:biopolymer transport protein ExbD